MKKIINSKILFDEVEEYNQIWEKLKEEITIENIKIDYEIQLSKKGVI